MPPGGAALTGATDPTRGYVPVAGQGAQHRLQADHYAGSLLSAIIITLIGYLYIALSNTMVYLPCVMYQCIALLTEKILSNSLIFHPVNWLNIK